MPWAATELPTASRCIIRAQTCAQRARRCRKQSDWEIVMSDSWLTSTKMSTVEDEASQPIHQSKRTLNKDKRVVLRGGSTSVTYKNISKKRRRYFSDLYTTLLDSSWSYCVLMFTTSFYGSWLFFGSLYFIICYMHGDLLEENLPNSGNGWVPWQHWTH